jgi:hypothetical protein
METMTRPNSKAPVCSACGTVTLTSEFDSEAHIIPNALGGRLSPKGLICRTCNSLLDRLADNALIKAFGPWPTLLNIPRDRGNQPAVVIEDADGQRMSVDADGTATRADVVYQVEPLEDGHKVSLGASNWKVVRQLIGRAAKQFPLLDPAQAELHAKKVLVPATAPWHIETNFAPQHVFPAAFVAFWLFFLYKTRSPLEPWDRIRKVIEGMRAGGTFRYLPEGLPGLFGPSIALSHRLVLRTVPATGHLIGYIEILGLLRIGGIIAEGPVGRKMEHIYVADPFAKSDRSSEFSIDAGVFDATNWRTIGIGPAERAGVIAYVEAAQKPLQDHWESRVKQLQT